MTDPDYSAEDHLEALRTRGIVVTLDGSTLDASGPLTATDDEDIRRYAVPLADALRARLRPEPPAPQPEPQPPAPPSPTVRFRGRAVTLADVRRCLTDSGDLDAYIAGEISEPDAYQRTRTWLKNRHDMADYFFTKD
ncbi:MAG: hypothetical protein AB7H93_16770 [Vicinamibacterales bacterium]